jgi:hypothetical protein
MTNKELIAQLRERIDPYYAVQRGTESYERKLCADALEAADKRIAELEIFKTAYLEQVELHNKTLSELREAERKLAIALDALEELCEWDGDLVLKDYCTDVLAQIGEK